MVTTDKIICRIIVYIYDFYIDYMDTKDLILKAEHQQEAKYTVEIHTRKLFYTEKYFYPFA